MTVGNASSGGDGIDRIRALLDAGGDDSLEALMRMTTTTATATVAGASHAGLTIRVGQRFVTAAATSEVPGTVDDHQYRHGGPCVDALTTDATSIRSDDLRREDRWPLFIAVVVANTEVRSMIAYRLRVGENEPFGSLNLYAESADAFDDAAVHSGARLAAYAAAVLSHGREHEKALGLERALASNRDIGAAVGILMTRHLLTRDDAFELIRDASQRNNRKVHDLAEFVIQTGAMPPDVH